jgi:signal transduction histidine kinase
MVQETFKKALTERSSYSIEFKIVNRDGNFRWVDQQAKVVANDRTGTSHKMFGTIKDITTRKEHERQIRKNTEEREILIDELTKSIKDLKQFTYITSHNLRAPLSNLVGLLGLIDYKALSEPNKNIVELFNASTVQLNKTINDLIQILIIKNNVNVKLTTNNLKTLITGVCNSMAYEITEADCKINLQLQVEELSFNKSYLESIIINLLSNAIKYRSPNRSLVLDISTTKNSNGEIWITFSDNGLGIDLKRHGKASSGYTRGFTQIQTVQGWGCSL